MFDPRGLEKGICVCLSACTYAYVSVCSGEQVKRKVCFTFFFFFCPGSTRSLDVSTQRLSEHEVFTIKIRRFFEALDQCTPSN